MIRAAGLQTSKVLTRCATSISVPQAQETVAHVRAGANPVQDFEVRDGYHLPEDEESVIEEMESPTRRQKEATVGGQVGNQLSTNLWRVNHQHHSQTAYDRSEAIREFRPEFRLFK